MRRPATRLSLVTASVAVFCLLIEGRLIDAQTTTTTDVVAAAAAATAAAAGSTPTTTRTLSTIDDDYERCREQGFGGDQLVCDPEKQLTESSRAKLTTLLSDLPTRIRCECAGGCQRTSGPSGFIGLLQVTDSFKAGNLSQSMRNIYSRAELGNDTCDHGLLIVYVRDEKSLATYRGGDTFVLLRQDDLQKLHELAVQSGDGDALALQYLLQNYDLRNPHVQKAESWTPLMGLIVALMVAVLVAAVIVGLLLAGLCCCCRKRAGSKKSYNVNTIPSYKTIDPIYVVTPAPSERLAGVTRGTPLMHHHHPESGIYSSPYSSSPLVPPPPPHLAAYLHAHPPPPPSHLTGSLPVGRRSRPVTPATPLYGARVAHPIGGGLGGSPPGSHRHVVPTSTTTAHPVDVSDESIRPDWPPTNAQPSSFIAHHHHNNNQPASPSSGSTTTDLPFLDPRRQTETQTREQFIE